MIRALLLLAAAPLFAWGPNAHRIMARLAEQQLTPEARAKVNALLAGASLADIANCADAIKKSGWQPSGPCARFASEPQLHTARWHFADIDIQDEYDPARHCPAANCVVERIRLLSRNWNDPASLMYLVHLVGDLHLPLRTTSRNQDRGGSLAIVRYLGGETTLDECWSQRWARELTYDEVAAASADASGTLDDWVRSSHRLGRESVYGALENNTITDAYERQAKQVMREQLHRAALRLAAILNGAAY